MMGNREGNTKGHNTNGKNWKCRNKKNKNKKKTSRCPAVSSFYGVFLSLLLMFIKIITDTEQKMINKETLHLYR